MKKIYVNYYIKKFPVFFFFVFIYLVFHIEVLSDYPKKGVEKYWIFFDMKEEVSLKKLNENFNDLRKLLSERAIKRRKKIDNRIIDETDLPVKAEYINYLSEMGISVLNISKWLNGVSAYLNSQEKQKVKNLPFVRDVKPVLGYIRKPIPSEEIKLFKPPSKYVHNYDYGFSFTQNNIINIPAVHDLGIVGRNILIGMLDTGFNRNHECLEDVKVLCEWDFINQDNYTGNELDDPPGQEKHGTWTLATVGGFCEGKLIGPAFGSTYALAKTEISGEGEEYKVEEDNWVRGIEWFDSIGVDIVSSSLGYAYGFRDGDDYTFSDLDGKTAITTIAAEMAVKKGMVVVNSVGNERLETWGHIITPADGENVIAVGAVGADSQITYFSSPGPTADGRIKPDVVAMGQNIWVPKFDNYDIVFDEYWGYARGTSFSCPLVSGAAALILSAHPNLTPAEVGEALINTADRANNPDNDYGYGLIDAYKAMLYFGTVFSNKPDIKSVEGKYRIMTSIVSPNGIPENSVFLHYKYSNGNGEFGTVVMEKGINTNQYFTDIEVQSFGTPVFYYFSVVDSASIQTFNPDGAPDDYYSYLSPFSQQLKSFVYQIYSRRFVLLNWTMRYEIDNLGFDVERSIDNKNYVKVAHIPGHGTTSTEQSYFFSDREINTGTYYYRLKKIDYSRFYEYSYPIEVVIESPKYFSVSQNYPNPFNAMTTIKYQISEDSKVEIKIYDILGREINTLINEIKSAGYYEAVWDGRDNDGLSVSSGTYFYRFKAGKFSDVKKITVLK